MIRSSASDKLSCMACLVLEARQPSDNVMLQSHLNCWTSQNEMKDNSKKQPFLTKIKAIPTFCPPRSWISHKWIWYPSYRAHNCVEHMLTDCDEFNWPHTICCFTKSSSSYDQDCREYGFFHVDHLRLLFCFWEPWVGIRSRQRCYFWICRYPRISHQSIRLS